NGQSFLELNDTRIDTSAKVKCIPEDACNSAKIGKMCENSKSRNRCLVSRKDYLPHCSNNNLEVNGVKGANISCNEDTGLYELDGGKLPEDTKIDCGDLETDKAERALHQCTGEPEKPVTKWKIMTGVVGFLLIPAIGVFVWQLMSFMKVYKQ
ncbi:hypothetical protein PFISCL1PPCAC_11579, partial [Pristionchus fissidentatus]